ncbi:MAG TPA: YidC/Oxa1 family membrane protein insertase [Gemmatimonadaceae bacterium]
MLDWSLVVDGVRALVFAAAHLFGNSVGSGILAVSVLVRLALLPLTLRAARRAQEHQARVAALKPELEKLRKKFGDDRAGLAEATLRLYRERGIGAVPQGTVGATLVQLPVGAALYQAFARGLGPKLSFLWVGDLARPDAILAGVAASLAGLAAGLGTTSSHRSAVALSATITLLIAWRLSASVALYWIASSGVGAVQALILRRGRRALAAD